MKKSPRNDGSPELMGEIVEDILSSSTPEQSVSLGRDMLMARKGRAK